MIKCLNFHYSNNTENKENKEKKRQTVQALRNFWKLVNLSSWTWLSTKLEDKLYYTNIIHEYVVKLISITAAF